MRVHGDLSRQHVGTGRRGRKRGRGEVVDIRRHMRRPREAGARGGGGRGGGGGVKGEGGVLIPSDPATALPSGVGQLL